MLGGYSEKIKSMFTMVSIVDIRPQVKVSEMEEKGVLRTPGRIM